ncbi:MAG: diguanylate cyclase [Magnetococcales bacterium]|nr:diguanylate cyclase [Magnetococcales bacterium]
MSTSKPSVQERIAKLRATFIDQLPERIAQARELLNRLQEQPGDPSVLEEMHRFFHGIKGTGRSFGLRELGVAAAQAEHWTTSLMEATRPNDPDEWLQQLEKYLDLITLMIDKVRAAPPDAQPESSPLLTESNDADGLNRRGRLVYICDDDMLTLEQLSSQLRCFGFKTLTFVNPHTLQAAVRDRRPDAVLMDIMFPQGHEAGPDAMTALRLEIGFSVPTIYFSARADFSARLAAVRAGGEAYFHKPVRALEMVAALDAITAHQLPDPFRILVIDDEPAVAEYHALILEGSGMVTRILSEPSRILEELQEFRSDLVLMDMYMPNCLGQDLARLIRQMPDYVGLPIVFLSGETDRKKQDSAMRIGAEGFLTKPVNPDDLISAVAVRAERMRALRSLMIRDSLTGLFNHTTTTQMLENAMATAQRSGTPLCFAMIDIDRFKSVNDTYGHPVGDQVILALSRVLHQRLRGSDVVGRYGGEEFAIILQDVALERASRLINELRLDFSRVQFHATKGRFSCTFSAGIAGMAGHASLESLREAADRALYLAKNNGRNRVVVDG